MLNEASPSAATPAGAAVPTDPAAAAAGTGRSDAASRGDGAGHRRALALGLVLAVTLNAVDLLAVVAAMPKASEDLGGDAWYGAAFTAYMLANLVGLVAAGEVADRRGPARPFLAGVATFAVGLAVSGFAGSMPVLVAGRFVQGLGAGAMSSVAYVAVSRAWPPQRQARLFAVLSAAWVAPALVTPALAGFVAQTLGWRWVFLGILPFALVIVVLAGPPLVRLGRPPVTDHRPSRVPLAFGLAAGVGLLVTGLSSDRWWLGVACGGIGLALAVVAGRRLLPPGVGRAAPGLAAAVACRFLVTYAFGSCDTFLPLAATRVHGATTTVAGAVVMGASIVWSGGAWYAARGGGRSPSTLVPRGFLVLAAAIVLTVPVASRGWPLPVAALTWAVGGFGIGVVFTILSAAAMAAAPAGRQGQVSSQLQIADALGFALAAGIGGALVGVADRGGHELTPALVLTFALGAAAALVGSLAARRLQAVEPAPASP